LDVDGDIGLEVFDVAAKAGREERPGLHKHGTTSFEFVRDGMVMVILFA